MPSLFAGKCHALLCRDYIKDRDWYDFIWYIARQVSINFIFLGKAIDQTGPWEKQNINVTKKWLIQQFNKKFVKLIGMQQNKMFLAF